jgi:hypothetical protein
MPDRTNNCVGIAAVLGFIRTMKLNVVSCNPQIIVTFLVTIMVNYQFLLVMEPICEVFVPQKVM